MWRARPPGAAEAREFRDARVRLGLDPLAVHANYLINLAAADGAIRAQSIAAFRGELERSSALGADYVVVHPGSYRGMTPAEGVEAAAASLADASEGLRTGRMMVLLEHTAGAGASLGSRFEELRAIRAAARKKTKIRIGYCLDTCHLYASGHDIASKKGLDAMTGEARETLGFEHVRVIHANDSKGGPGSHLDRHANIGEGRIGESGFRRILAHPAWKEKPFILETPVENDGDDRKNLDTLKRLCPRSRTTTTRSS
jgi:deoxyribonuclease IV